MLRRYYGKISKLPINEFFGHDGELVVDDITGKVYVMDGITLGGTELVGATPRFGTTPPDNPTPGALWYDPASGRTYIYFQDTWVDAAPNTTYTLPNASHTILGGVKVDNATIVIDEFGVISAIGDGTTTDRLVSAGNSGRYMVLNDDGVLNLPYTDSYQASIIRANPDAVGGGGGLTIKTGALVENTWNFSQAGNLSLPGEGNITSSSGNINVLGNVGALSFHAAQGVDRGAGFLFIDPITGRYTSGMRHSNTYNTLQIVHEGNIGLELYSNGLSKFKNIKVTDHVDANSAYISTQKILANVGFQNGYRFYDDSNIKSTALIHDSVKNQLQLSHEYGVVALNSNGSLETSNIILSGTTLSTQLGTLYVDGIAVVTGSGSGTSTSPSPPVDPTNGQLWYDTTSGKIYVYLNDSWVDASPTFIPNVSSLINGVYAVTLDTDGNLNLPAGGDILDSNGNSVLVATNYGNTNVAAYLPTNSVIISLRANLAGQTANSATQATAINTLNANALSQDTQIKGLRANITAANAAIISANVSMKSYVDNVTFAWTANSIIQENKITLINANLANQTANANVQATAINTLIANASSQETKIRALRANINAANAAIISANASMKTYVDGKNDLLTANAISQENKITLINANLANQTSNSITQATSIDTLTANASSQTLQINGLRANITSANSSIATLKTQVYSNANVFAFLPTYSGTVGGDISIGGNIVVDGSITVGTLLQAPRYTKASNATGTVGQICWDANYIYVCTATNTWKRVALTGGY